VSEGRRFRTSDDSDYFADIYPVSFAQYGMDGIANPYAP